MTDLLTLAREHDLPPKWDGVPVEWLGWQTLPRGVFICPPPKDIDCCTKCGSIEVSVINRGVRRVWLAGKDRCLDSLIAYRCTDCKHDVVNEHDSDEWWDLDHTDYGDDGSICP